MKADLEFAKNYDEFCSAEELVARFNSRNQEILDQQQSEEEIKQKEFDAMIEEKRVFALSVTPLNAICEDLWRYH